MRQPLLVGLSLLSLLTLTAFLYWPALDGPLLADDQANLAPLQSLDSPLVDPVDVITTNHSGPLGRPVAMASFVGNYLAHGWNVSRFKYTNLMLHLMTGCLVIWLAALLFQEIFPDKKPWPIALLVGALWLLSPFLVSTVLYTVQRMAQLAAFFVLAGCLTYVLGRRTLNTTPRLGIPLTLSTLILWTPLAALSKENGALLPALLLLIELFFFKFSGARFTRRYLITFFVLGLALPALATLLVLSFRWQSITQGYLARDFDLGQRLLTEPRVLLDYLWNLLIPVKSGSFGLFHDDFKLSQSLFNPLSTLAALLFWSFVVLFSLRVRTALHRSIAFGLMFFLTAHAVESSIFPLELYFEHRNYLPAFGIFFAVGAILSFLFSKFAVPRRTAAVALLVPLAFAFSTYQRAQAWTSKEIMLLSAQSYHPQSPRLHAELANLYATYGSREQAIQHLEKVTELNANLRWGPTIHRIAIYCATHAPIPIDAYSALNINATHRPSHVDKVYTGFALENVNRYLKEGQCPQLDLERYSAWLANWMRHLPRPLQGRALESIVFHVAITQEIAGNHDTALSLLEEILTYSPNHKMARLSAIKMSLARDDQPSANRHIQVLLESTVDDNPEGIENDRVSNRLW